MAGDYTYLVLTDAILLVWLLRTNGLKSATLEWLATA
ncbi:hypothetical protein EDC91_102233 [Shewanella fodinae]|uniref:Uncharacterized protein n=1 Tax=Shewanella fodinae TaxID=552357 RepID=A0A4R2FHI5_9GAMM|nr:hypothetical protein EDC91_102233 [Shewanella fodinae]